MSIESNAPRPIEESLNVVPLGVAGSILPIDSIQLIPPDELESFGEGELEPPPPLTRSDNTLVWPSSDKFQASSEAPPSPLTRRNAESSISFNSSTGRGGMPPDSTSSNGLEPLDRKEELRASSTETTLKSSGFKTRMAKGALGSFLLLVGGLPKTVMNLPILKQVCSGLSFIGELGGRAVGTALGAVISDSERGAEVGAKIGAVLLDPRTIFTGISKAANSLLKSSGVGFSKLAMIHSIINVDIKESLDNEKYIKQERKNLLIEAAKIRGYSGHDSLELATDWLALEENGIDQKDRNDIKKEIKELEKEINNLSNEIKPNNEISTHDNTTNRATYKNINAQLTKSTQIGEKIAQLKQAKYMLKCLDSETTLSLVLNQLEGNSIPNKLELLTQMQNLTNQNDILISEVEKSSGKDFFEVDFAIDSEAREKYNLIVENNTLRENIKKQINLL